MPRPLKVSTSTVSKALSDSYEISPKTKQRVIKFAREHNYAPSRSAKSLRLGKSKMIGVVVNNISNTFSSQVLQGIQLHLEEEGFHAIITQSFSDEKIEKECLENLMKSGVDGILISPVRINSNIRLLKRLQKRFPIIFFDRIGSALDTYKIGIDNEGGGVMATQQLLRRGKKNIAIILARDVGNSESRLNGYKKALKQYRHEFNKENVHDVKLGNLQAVDQEIYGFINRKFYSPNPIDGLVCGSETISIRSLGVLTEMNIKVPEDIAIVGFANTDFAFSLNPPLTSASPKTPILENSLTIN